MKRWIGLLALALGASPAAAQEDGLAGRCPTTPAEAREICLAVAQAVESAQPQIGMVMAGGNPTLGAAGRGGLRIGFLPDVDVTGRVNLVFVRLPDILATQVGGAAGRFGQTLGVPAPALGANVAVGVFPGFDLVPGIGGMGSISLLAGASWLPFRTFGTRGFDTEAPDLAWGGGVRVGLLRETFIAPGASVSVMYRSLGNVAFGDVEAGNAGEFAFDLRNWSTRAVVGKRLLGLGLLGGLGYDRYASDVSFAFRLPPSAPPGPGFERIPNADLRSSRWSAFGNLSYTLLLATLALEAGWQQGDSPVPGFGQGARFDPRGGAWFTSAGVRVAF
jgi:hypothetical protein